MKHRGVFLFCVFFAIIAGLAAQEGEARFALVIGNGGYRHVDNLPNAVNDASDVAAKLSGLGYQVDLNLDADLPGMTRAISAWMRRLSEDRSSEGFFWYAGHGIQAAGENYLLPVDIDADDEAGIVYGSYPLGRLLLSLEQTAKNKLNVVVLDACRDNPFRNLAGGNRGLSRGFVTVEHPPQDIFIMFSTAPGTVAADGEGKRNSPFTEAFLQYMDSGEILPVMAGLVTRETMRLTGGKQRPYQNGSIVSELYYSLLPGASVTNPAVPDTDVPRSTVLASRPETAEPPTAAISYTYYMASVPSGSFSMGSPGMELDRVEFRERLHEVQLSAFSLGSREVSLGEFRRFVEETGYRTTAERAGGAFAYNETSSEWEFTADADWRRPGFAQGEDHPVVNVSWFDAVEYCNWLSQKEGLRPAYAVSGEDVRWDKSADGYRLPTEAEWEYACRAGTTTPFSTGQRISTSQANYNGNFPYANGNQGLYRKGSSPVASFPPNGWGLYDMHGNAWEWCWDYYDLYEREPVTDPAGPDSGEHRICRGGSWSSYAKNLRSAARSGDFPDAAVSNIGFRMARNKAD
jgi:formylglycine-generating enzyme required for sulfatase activity